ncbi:MAG: cytochrome c [Verrucomicrobia bacterium]|nr:cytochrome c [Verrucomicrobiota bacterium]
MPDDKKITPPPAPTLNPDLGEQHDVGDIHAALQREKPDPEEGFEPINLWLVALTGGLLFWGGYYLANFSGRFEANEYSEIPRGQAVAAAPAETPEQKTLRLGAQLYNNCAACHLADGTGNPALNIPPLAGSDWVLADGPDRLTRIVLHGLNGPIKVNGQVWQGNAMNPWKKTAENPSGLADEEIAAVLSYIRNAWGNKASFVTVDQVRAVNEATKDRTEPWTEAELLAVPVSGGAAPAGGAPLDLAGLKGELQKLPPEELKKLLEAIQAK